MEAACHLFQSLAGFFVACNAEGLPKTWLNHMFQSLAGFFVACNRPALPRAGGNILRVSIPGGFFRGLQPYGIIRRNTARKEFQSLAGFFVACNFMARSTYPESLSAFQSLAGFFVACNRFYCPSGASMVVVSIPGGFFRGLQHDRIGRARPGRPRFQSLAGFFVACNVRMAFRFYSNVNAQFQSLAGFFVACNRGEPPRPTIYELSFNPWRVFSWLATYPDHEDMEARGFVSIPGGFFRGLQHIDPAKYEGYRIVFQSLAGFFVACNGTPELVISRYKAF